ncbi:hypothetical protein ACWCP6_34920 [Streptomyces sp. NPDC002004]
MEGQRGEIELAGRSDETAVEQTPVSDQPGLLVMLAVEDGTAAFNEAIDEQLEAVAAWWTPDRGFRVMETRTPQSRHDVELYLERAGIREVESDVPLVLFLTGHGLAASRHYLLLQETDRRRLLATALPTCDVVVAALDSYAEDILVIVNLCEAAGIASELQASMRDLAPERSRGRLHVLATTGDRTAVLGREFALILEEARTWLRTAGGITRPWLSMTEFLEALNAGTEIVNEKYHRTIEGPMPLLTGNMFKPTAALPNPRFQPEPADAAEDADEASVAVQELEYWLEKASGRTRPEDPGWYFSGREELNAELAAFFDGPPGVLIVTGVTASGKSAVLGRAVALSDASFRSSEQFTTAVRESPAPTVPAQGAVTVAVSARNSTPLSLLKALCRGLGVLEKPVEGDDVRAWQEAVRAGVKSHASTVTVVVDAVDEAVSPARCVSDVLAPLAALTKTPQGPLGFVPAQGGAGHGRPRGGLRLVLGLRSSGPAPRAPQGLRGQSLLSALCATFPHARELRTDGDGVEKDIRRYVRALLEGRLGWEEHHRDRAAKLVAQKVKPSFLDAQRAAAQLREGGPGLLDESAWLGQLDRGTVGILEADLEACAAADGGLLSAPEALSLLRATAFARGRGMAWGAVWPAVAAAVHGAPIEDADRKIDTLLHGPLSGYLSHDVEDERIVYRPAHDRLGRILRRRPVMAGQPAGGMVGESDGADSAGSAGDEDERTVHASISAALARLAGGLPGSPPPPYVRRHLAEHAQLGEVLDDEHVPLSLLPWETSGAIRGLLSAAGGQGRRAWLEAWAAVEPYVRQADAVSRLGSLHLMHTALSHRGVPRPRLPVDSSPLGSPLGIVWSQWQPPAHVLATVDACVHALAPVTTPDGGVLLAAGDEQGRIEFIDTATGGPAGNALSPHDGAVRSLAGVHDVCVLASGSTDGTVRIWDPINARLIDQIGRPGSVWTDDVVAYRSVGDSVWVVAVKGDGTLTQWNDTPTTRSLPPVEPVRKAAVTTVTTDDGDRMLVTAGQTLSVRDLATGEVLRSWPLPQTEQEELRALAPTPLPATVASGHADGTVRVWNLTTGTHTAFHSPGAPVTCLASVTVDGRQVLAASSGRTIVLWEMSEAAQARRLTGHTDTVTALACVTVAGQDALASAGRDNTVRLWDRTALREVLDGHSVQVPPVTGAVLHAPAGDAPLLAVAAENRVKLWSLDAGSAVADFPTGSGPMTAMAWADLPAGRTLLWAAHDASIRCWNATADRSLPGRLEEHTLPVTGLASCTTSEGRRIALSGGKDHRVVLWDLQSMQRLRTWRGHRLPVRAVAAASDTHYDWLASASSDGTVRLWAPDRSAAEAVMWCDQGVINAVAINARPQDGLPPYLASGGDDGSVQLWDLLTGQPLNSRMSGHAASVEAVAAWSTEGLGSYVASASRDGTVRVWDAADGRCLLQLATTVPVRFLSAHPAAPGHVMLTLAGDAGVLVSELDLRDL